MSGGPSVPLRLVQLALLLCAIWTLAKCAIFGGQIGGNAPVHVQYVPYDSVDIHCSNGSHITPELYRMAPQERWLEPWFNADSKPLCTPFGLLFVCQASQGEIPVHTTKTHGQRRHLRGNTPLSWIWRLAGSSNLARVDGDRTRQALKIAFGTATTASPSAYNRAVMQGDPARLQRALRKFVAGEPTKIVLLGGSVAVGMGVTDRNNSFASLLSKWFHSFEPLVGSNVQFINSAVAATTSSYASQCVDDFVPKDTDVVFLEYALNDWEVVNMTKVNWMDNYQRRGYERLIRKILALPKSPAVILIHWWAAPHFRYSFWNVAEDEFDTMGKYYGLSSISFRNAYYHQIMTARPGFNLTELMCDGVHPNILGHRYFGDLIIAHLQVNLAEALLLPPEEGPWLNAVPPPLFEGNNITSSGKCARDDAFKQTVVSAQGFEWINQAREGAPQAKWGYAGSKPGSYLLIQVGKGKNTDRRPIAPRQTLVALGVLKSYDGMGVANVSCVPSRAQPEQCSCSDWQIDMHHEPHTSQVYWISGLVKTGADCLLRVAIANSTSSGGHRVVVTSLMVGDDDTDDIRGFSAFGSAPIEVDGDNSTPH